MATATDDEDWPETRPLGSASPRPAGETPAAAPKPRSGSGTSPSGIDAQTVRRAWDEIVRLVGQSSKKAAAFAREAVVREIEGQTLVLVFKHRIHADGVNNEPAPLLEAVHQVLGGVWSVRCEINGDARPPAAASAASGASRAKTAAPAASAPAPARPAPATSEPMPSDDEVPYDPEFDGPARPIREGFDPGDEPDPETDSLAVRQTSEEQALDSLRTAFEVVEKIADNR